MRDLRFCPYEARSHPSVIPFPLSLSLSLAPRECLHGALTPSLSGIERRLSLKCLVHIGWRNALSQRMRHMSDMQQDLSGYDRKRQFIASALC